jgi:hypothetical protein
MKRIVFIGAALAAMLLSGCTSADSATQSEQRGMPGAAAPQPATDWDSSAGKDATSDALAPAAPGEGVQPPGAPAEGRSLIYRADLTIRVEDVEAASGKVTAIASTLGGHLSSEKRSTGTRSASAVMTLRVPSDKFATAMERLSKEIGKEENRSSNTEDVTEAIVDLDTRIAAQRASVESVRRMFERATALTDVVLLEKELSQRQAELASLEAKKRRLGDLVSLSTITVTVAGPNTELPEIEEDTPGFLGGLEEGWDAFLRFGSGLGYLLAYLLPFLLALAIPVTALYWLLRVRRRRPLPSQEPQGQAPQA